jgi:hypothetical protein
MKTLPAGTIKRLHVHRVRLRAGEPDSLTVQTSKGPIKGARVEVRGPSTFVCRPEKPLSCGAKAWVETRAQVDIFGPDED